MQKSVRDHEFEALQGKVQRLEKLRRALKVERNELNKKVQSLCGDHGGGGGTETPAPNPETDSPSPPLPPTDASPAPESDTAPPSQPRQDTDTVLKVAVAPAPQQ